MSARILSASGPRVITAVPSSFTSTAMPSQPMVSRLSTSGSSSMAMSLM